MRRRPATGCRSRSSTTVRGRRRRGRARRRRPSRHGRLHAGGRAAGPRVRPRGGGRWLDRCSRSSACTGGGIVWTRNLASAPSSCLGFEREGCRRRRGAGGEWVDDIRYGLNADQHAAWRRDHRAGGRRRPGRHHPRPLHAPDGAAHAPEPGALRVAGRNPYADAMFPDSGTGRRSCRGWAIVADGELAGFVMLAEATAYHPVPYLWRLGLIDRRHQRRGIGDTRHRPARGAAAGRRPHGAARRVAPGAGRGLSRSTCGAPGRRAPSTTMRSRAASTSRSPPPELVHGHAPHGAGGPLLAVLDVLGLQRRHLRRSTPGRPRAPRRGPARAPTTAATSRRRSGQPGPGHVPRRRMSSSRRSCPVRFGLWSTALASQPSTTAKHTGTRRTAPSPSVVPRRATRAATERGGHPRGRFVHRSIMSACHAMAGAADPAGVSDYQQILVEQVDAVYDDHPQPPGEAERLHAHDDGRADRAVTAANDDPSIGAIVVTGAGRGFCAGADIEAVFGKSLDEDHQEEQAPPPVPRDRLGAARAATPSR